jgi:hypothetical protein
MNSRREHGEACIAFQDLLLEVIKKTGFMKTPLLFEVNIIIKVVPNLL